MWLRLVALLLLIATSGQAGVAPDIARGTTADEVIRAYGWPKGKIVADGRESWTYDRFHVLLENGKVVSVSHIPPPPSAANKSLPAAPGHPASSPSAPAPDHAIGRPGSDRPAAEPLVPDSVLWGVAGIGALSLGLALGVGWYVRRSRQTPVPTRTMDAARTPAPAPPGVAHQEKKMLPAPAAAAPLAPDRKTASDTVSRRTPAPPASVPGPAVATSLTLEQLHQLDSKQLELLAIRYFNETGFRAEPTRLGAEGGVDIFLYRPNEHKAFGYVLCRPANERPVELKPVRDLFSLMAAHGIREGTFVTIGTFAPEAGHFADGRPLILIDGRDLITRLDALPADARARVLAGIRPIVGR